jgi:hypothetical protein
MADRYVVIVPRGATETLAYLTESFKNVPDVEVVVERRRSPAPSVRPLVDRRAAADPRHVQEAFGCRLVRIPRAEAPAAPPEEPPAPSPGPAAQSSESPAPVDDFQLPPPAPKRFGPLRLRSAPITRRA